MRLGSLTASPRTPAIGNKAPVGSDEIVSTAVQVLGASDNAAGVDFIS